MDGKGPLMNYAELLENVFYMGCLTWAVWLVSEWLCRPIPIDED
jgi:hypothetical protein